MLKQFLAALLPVIASATLVAAQSNQSHEFTYQGRLTNSGMPASGSHDLRFRLMDSLDGGAQVGPILCVNDLSIADGMFSVRLDFGDVFDGAARYLEIEVRANSPLPCDNAGGFTVLLPRQAIPATPYALHAAVASRVPVRNRPPSPRVGEIRFDLERKDFLGYNGGWWSSLTGRGGIAPANLYSYPPGTYSFVVPPGTTSIAVELWAGGGAGGGVTGSSTVCDPLFGQVPLGGGGGGSGAYTVGIVDVVPGETLTLEVGAGGLYSGSGQPGGNSRIRRGSTSLVEAGGGAGGPTGGVGPAQSVGCNTCCTYVTATPGGVGGTVVVSGNVTSYEGNAGGSAMKGGCFFQQLVCATGGTGGFQVWRAYELEDLDIPHPPGGTGRGGIGDSPTTGGWTPGGHGHAFIFWN